MHRGPILAISNIIATAVWLVWMFCWWAGVVGGLNGLFNIHPAIGFVIVFVSMIVLPRVTGAAGLVLGIWCAITVWHWSPWVAVLLYAWSICLIFAKRAFRIILSALIIIVENLNLLLGPRK